MNSTLHTDCLRHQAEIDNYLSRREEEAEKLRQEMDTANASRLASLKARLEAVPLFFEA